MAVGTDFDAVVSLFMFAKISDTNSFTAYVEGAALGVSVFPMSDIW